MWIRKSGKGLMMIKLDLEKAYDRLSWDFLHDILRAIGLPNTWLDLMMNCTQANKLNILWNGMSSETVKPTRGNRQGDPLSLYLFILCIERLSHMIRDKIQEGVWRLITLCRGGPQLSHIMFVNDIVLFVKASLEQARMTKECLDSFSDWSDQKVSYSKSMVCLSTNVNVNLANQKATEIGIPVSNDFVLYLRVPTLHTRVNKNTYHHFLDNLKTKLADWKSSSLSMAGCITLAKSVLNTAPFYTMQTSKIPVSILDEMKCLIRSFVWGHEASTRKLHLIS